MAPIGHCFVIPLTACLCLKPRQTLAQLRAGPLLYAVLWCVVLCAVFEICCQQESLAGMHSFYTNLKSKPHAHVLLLFYSKLLPPCRCLYAIFEAKRKWTQPL